MKELPGTHGKRDTGRKPVEIGARVKDLPLTPEAEAIINKWAACLPPMISRKKSIWFLGGIISNKVLACLDSRGCGPEGAVRVGREIVYDTRKLLIFLARTRGLEIVKSVRSLDELLTNSSLQPPRA